MNLEAHLRGLATDRQPDPLFRHRLRSEVLNRWVATREGLAPAPERRWIGREMGRLGRACLYATVALGISAAGVLAVSQEAVPDATLYELKLRIEELRVEVLPRHLHDELALNVLAERVDEVRRMTAAGSVDGALALAPDIERAYADVQALLATAGPADAVMIEHRLAAVAGLVEALRPDLRAILAALMPGLEIAQPTPAEPNPADPTPEPPREAVPVAPAGPPQLPAIAPPEDAAADDDDDDDEGADRDDRADEDRDDESDDGEDDDDEDDDDEDDDDEDDDQDDEGNGDD
jgi:hypothetical protein